MFVQTLLTNQQSCDWALVGGWSKAVASGGKLLVNLCKQVLDYLTAGFAIPFIFTSTLNY